MHIKPGDLIVIVAPLEHIDVDCPGPGTFGTVIAVCEPDLLTSLRFGPRRWYECDFSGTQCACLEGTIRKLPPDDGRKLVRWDWRTLGKPNRSLVEA